MDVFRRNVYHVFAILRVRLSFSFIALFMAWGRWNCLLPSMDAKDASFPVNGVELTRTRQTYSCTSEQRESSPFFFENSPSIIRRRPRRVWNGAAATMRTWKRTWRTNNVRVPTTVAAKKHTGRKHAADEIETQKSNAHDRNGAPTRAGRNRRTQGWATKPKPKGSKSENFQQIEGQEEGWRSREKVGKQRTKIAKPALENAPNLSVEIETAEGLPVATPNQIKPVRGPSSPLYVKKKRKWEAETDWLLMGVQNEAIEDRVFDALVEKHKLEQRCRPLVSYLYQLGFRDAEFAKLIDARVEVLSLTVATAKSRVLYLSSLGIQPQDLVKIIAKHPRVLEYRTERTMKPRVEYLREICVEEQDLAKVITRAPVLLELSVNKTLRPRAQYLTQEVGIPEDAIGKLVTKHPAVLTYNSDTMVAPRMRFFLDLGVSKEGLAKMVTRHPQLLHYSIDSMKPRLDYLQAIGMSEEEIVTTVSRLGTLFSLSIESSLRPKFEYLTAELGGDVQTVAKFPAYFSLSLDKRIRPRHQFLLSRKGLAGSKMPMKYLSLTDKDFVSLVDSTLKEYEEFKNEMLVRDFAVKFSTCTIPSKV